MRTIGLALLLILGGSGNARTQEPEFLGLYRFTDKGARVVCYSLVGNIIPSYATLSCVRVPSGEPFPAPGFVTP